MKPGTRLTAMYLCVQGAAGVVWWLFLYAVPSSQSHFSPDGLPDAFILSYAFADIALFVILSLISALAFALRHSLARIPLLILTGAVLYSALHCIGLQLQYGGYEAPTALMFAAATCTTILAVVSHPSHGPLPDIAFRQSTSPKIQAVYLKTGIQIVIFWSVFLLVIPLGILFVERRIGIVGFSPSPVLGWIIFACGSAAGLLSGFSMAKYGNGTPLPTDSAPFLVIRGPYKYIRNPMVVAGLSQGLAVAFLLGSWLMIPYVLLGGVFWQFCVRPAEELDLRARFGDEYDDYRSRVRCWNPIPRGKQSP